MKLNNHHVNYVLTPHQNHSTNEDVKNIRPKERVE